MFSALVGIFATKALDIVSIYEGHKHPDTPQQRFPDLSRRGYPGTPLAKHYLEIKGSKRPREVQSHYNHETFACTEFLGSKGLRGAYRGGPEPAEPTASI